MRSLDIEGPGEPVPKLDLSTGPSGDAPFAFVEQLARSLRGTGGLEPAAAKIVTALEQNAQRYEQSLGEPRGDVMHAFLVNELCHLFGDNIYDPEPIAAVLNLDPKSIDGDELISFLNELRIDPPAIEEEYRSAPIDDVVYVAGALLSIAPEVIRHLGIVGLIDAEVEDLAATFAPLGVHFARLLRARFDDFPLVLPSAEPSPALVPVGSGSDDPLALRAVVREPLVDARLVEPAALSSVHREDDV
jgi:hypothetical protein